MVRAPSDIDIDIQTMNDTYVTEPSFTAGLRRNRDIIGTHKHFLKLLPQKKCVSVIIYKARSQQAFSKERLV